MKKWMRRTATWLYCKRVGKGLVGISETVKRDLRVLHPGKPLEELVEAYYVQKIQITLTVFLGGIILAAAIFL